MKAKTFVRQPLLLSSPRHVFGRDVRMMVLVLRKDLFTMDGDGLLGAPVDTGQAMTAMGTDDGPFRRTDDIAHRTDAGTEAAGNTASPIDRWRQPAFPGMADQAQVHEPGRDR